MAEFLQSGAAAVAAITITNPLDVLRTHLQHQKLNSSSSKNIVSMTSHLVKTHGISVLQRGLVPAWCLQFSNVSMRFGVYHYLKNKNDDSFLTSLLTAAFSGAIAGSVSAPFFLLKNNLQLQKSNTTNMYSLASTILSKNGISGFYVGSSAFIVRVMVASAVQLATYDHLKYFILNANIVCTDNVLCHTVASFGTGLAVVGAMQPFDYAATRAGTSSFKNNRISVSKVLIDTYKEEGIKGWYKGSLASYLRFGPYCTLVFVFLEQFRKL